MTPLKTRTRNKYNIPRASYTPKKRHFAVPAKTVALAISSAGAPGIVSSVLPVVYLTSTTFSCSVFPIPEPARNEYFYDGHVVVLDV